MVDKGSPRVSVICLCYNHEPFVAEAIESVLNQSYENIELIVVDDASSDDSAEVIRKICEKEDIRYTLNSQNIGNCRAFNQAFQECSGQFIIDLAADDILQPERVAIGVAELNNKGKEFGVHYSDAMQIDENGNELGLHTAMTKTIDKNEKMPEGDVFTEVLARYFICPPTIMARREVFEELGGYDENLSYEDFDFLVRSSRKFRFCYSPKILVKRRILKGSKSQVQFLGNNRDLQSTVDVCKKAFGLIENRKEKKALNQRLQYECRQAIVHGNNRIVAQYLDLMKKNGVSVFTRSVYALMADMYPKVFR